MHRYKIFFWENLKIEKLTEKIYLGKNFASVIIQFKKETNLNEDYIFKISKIEDL